jgi:hypothetical protein
VSFWSLFDSSGFRRLGDKEGYSAHQHFHFDFNVSQFFVGPPNVSGFDQSQELNLAFSHFIYGGLQITGDFYEQRFALLNQRVRTIGSMSANALSSTFG